MITIDNILKKRRTSPNMRLAVRSGRQFISSYDRIGVPALTHGGLTIKPLLSQFIMFRSPATSATRGTLADMRLVNQLESAMN